MTKHHFMRGFATLCLGVALAAAPAMVSAAPVAPAAADTADTAAKKNAVPTDDPHHRNQSYAERQAENPRTAAFKGNGVGVYIGGSTLAVVLVVVLVVVLL